MDISDQNKENTTDISHVTDQSSSMSRLPPYEVFLSSRGVDMRRGFADFLYTMLIDVGISVFRDEEELERGKLIQEIKQCKISIPIISEEYLSSKSSLSELEQMVECTDNKILIIIPIFYYVDPSDARNCRGPFVKALDEQKKRDGDAIFGDRLMSAFREIGELKGHHLHEEVSPGKFVKRIVHQVQQKLKKEELIVTKQLVGVDSHVQGIMAKLKVDYLNGQAIRIGDAREKVLGIYGLPGVGKTVLAKCVYNQLYHLFDACSFLGDIQAEIKHRSIVSVQNKLISDLDKGNAKTFDSSKEALSHMKNFCTMKVLVLLDDVHDHEQLSTLIGELDWLDPGSRVIVTSQTQDVLGNIDGTESFVLEPMKHDEALKLFSRHAFGTDTPREKFEDLSTDIVAATGWLPLALEVIGSSLFLVKVKKAWRETLTALEEAPHESVQAALEKSYTTLDKKAQQIFLDIACFFIGMDKRIPYYMWHDCNYFPSASIKALHARSFIEIGEDHELRMHEILKKFGREIVTNENRNEPCKRSRLCDHEEALHVLGRKEGTEKVEALGLEFGDGSKGNISFECDRFDGLQNLRFLKLDQADICGNFGDRLSSLRWLDWQGCPKTFDIKSLNLNLQNLVILDLSGSQIDQDWRGWELLVVIRKLKVLKLIGCVRLITTPKFPASMELERLILEGCSNLAVIDPSVSNLEKLVSLNMKKCSILCELPDLGPMRDLEELVIDGTAIAWIDFQEGSMGKLKILSAHNCKSLTQISPSIRYLESLTYLVLDGSKIGTLPESIGLLKELNTLSLKNCGSLSNLPDGIGMLRSLQFLDLSETAIQKLPASVKDLEAMKVLRMRDTSIREFPEAILNLKKLEEIDFSLCQSLEGKIPEDVGRLSSLAILKLSNTQISGLPPSISSLSHLRELHISGCSNLQSLPELPSSLINVFGSDGKLIRQIVGEASQKLKEEEPIGTKQLVGVDSHVQGIMAKLEVDYRYGQAVKIGDTGVKVLGIYGIPGVGKTVLAKYVYDQIYHLFDACSFLWEIQEEISDHGILSVQNRLISHLRKGNAPKFDSSDHAQIYIRNRFLNVKILLLLDDVKDHEQLTALAGELDWLGPWSRVILTSQRQDVLKKITGVESVFLEPMNQDEALKLFCWHAFGTDSPPQEFEELSTNIIAATDGLPLALRKVGESLFRKSKNVWKEKLIQLKEAPDESVLAAFLKSYTTLDENAQQIFLDIACFFSGMDKRIPYYMWHDLQFYPEISVLSLRALSLVEIGEDKELRMREILKAFGREIVKSENKNEPCQRSRLWNHEEALDVLIGGKGTEKVEALGLKFADRSEGYNISFQRDKFDGLQNLRFLELDRADIKGNFQGHFLRLRWLGWQGTPSMFDIKLLNLELQNLVILDLSGSQVHREWKGWKLLSTARKLKVLNLTGCAHLSSTPKFPASLGLERLILEGCSNLAVIDPSLGNLEELVSLNMKGCSLLCKLTDLGPMRSLKELVIDGTSISRINVREGSMRKLKFLSARNCENLTEISDSIRYLESLKYLSLDGSKINTLPESIGSLAELKTLSLKNCRRLTDLPDGIGRLSSLQLLDLSDIAIKKLPTSVKDLKAMKVLRGTFI